MSALARIPAPKELMDYVQGLLWNSGELGRAVCRRGWSAPDIWALAPADQPAQRIPRPGNANAWVDEWLIAQGRVSDQLCLVAQDLLAPPFDAESALEEFPGRWDVRSEQSYFVVEKPVFGVGVMKATTGWMIGDEFILYVIEDDWPFKRRRPLSELADRVRHILVPVSEGESYGVVSGA